MSANIPGPLADAPRLSDWIEVSDETGVTFFTGRVELGQGNAAALVAMAADELGVAPGDIALQTARTDRTPNEGYTAGSMSISVGGLALRWAASALRVLILKAAAADLSIPAEELDTEGGAIVRNGTPTGLSVLDHAARVDLSADIAESAAPRTAATRRTGSGDMPRPDLRARMTGAPFVHDMTAPDMLFGAPIHPPGRNATLLSLDLDALKAWPGVVEVLRNGSWAGVVAETPLAAAKAVDWARANGVWETPTSEIGDPLDVISSSLEESETVLETGDINRNVGRWFETTITRPYLHHGSIGPSAAVAVWQDDKATVWTHSQGVFQLRKAIAMTLRMPEQAFTVIHRPGAGCYGHNGADDAALDAVLLARAVAGRPVKVVWSRQDEFRVSPMGPGMSTKVRALLGPDGTLTAFDVAVNSAPHANRPGMGTSPNLCAAAYLADPIAPARASDLPLARGGAADRNAVPGYAVGAVRVQKRLVHDLPYRSSSLRSLGAYNNVLAIETLMDDIAHEIGETPLGFRLRHIDDARSRAVLERLDQETRAARAEPLPEGAGWGLGFARYKNSAGYCAVMARVEVDGEVRVTDAVSVADVGEVISADGTVAQIEGGIIQSISWTLKEAASFDGDAVAAGSWLDYPILTFSEVPRLKTILIDRPDQPPLGAGEISQGPAAAAVSNAVRAALGVRVRRLPITRSAVIAAASA